MVNMTMDDYGLEEPTDVGVMTINYDSKDESTKRRHIRWDHDEVIFMLHAIKEKNLVHNNSMNKISITVSELLTDRGWNRTDKQVAMKLTVLRKQFLICERDRVKTGSLIACPYYNELREIYHDCSSSGSFSNDNLDLDECFITFPDDYVSWSKGEIYRLLSSIRTLKLKNDISLTSFSAVAVKMLTDILQNSGFNKTISQVRNILNYLRTMYIDYRIGLESNKNPKECMFYSNLDLIWGKEYKKYRLKERKYKVNGSWTAEETALLLIQVQDLNIAEAAYNRPEKASKDLRISLAQKGCNKTESQIIDRLYQLKSDFAEADKCYTNDADAVLKFTFYSSYKKLFKHFYDVDETRSDSSFSDTWSFTDNCSDISKEADWEQNEVKFLLTGVQRLTATSHSNDSLENEKLKKLEKLLGDNGYHKTALQIKHKLTLLKDSYLKCNEDNLEDDGTGTIQCPFYEELHNMFSVSQTDDRNDAIQNLVNSNNDMGSPPKDVDHSYTNENNINDKVKVIPNKCMDSWFPVKNIIDEGIGETSLEDLGNLSSLSTSEQEQVIEEALLATLPKDNNCNLTTGNPIDYKNETAFSGNQTTAPYETAQSNNFAAMNNLDCFTQRNMNNIENTGLTQEFMGTNSHIMNQTNYDSVLDDSSSCASTTSSMKRNISPFGDEVLQPSKKLRLMEDVKTTDKNKFFLRPIGMDSTALNINNSTNNKFVRLIVANDGKTNKPITAHLKPMGNNNNNNAATANTRNNCIDKMDILKLAAEKMLENKREGSLPNPCTNFKEEIEAKVTETIKSAMKVMMDHNEVLQQRHHSWMAKQLELQRKYNDEINSMMMNEIKELRHTVTLLLTKQPQADKKKQ